MTTGRTRVTAKDVLRNWAVAEASSKRQWSSLRQLVSPTTVKKLDKGQPDTLSEAEWENLERLIVQSRASLLKGLLRLNLRWHRGELAAEELNSLHMINWPPFTELAGSTRLVDLVAALERGQMPPDHEQFALSLRRIQRDFKVERMIGNPILVSETSRPPYYLIEGYTRCCAMLLNLRRGTLPIRRFPVLHGIGRALQKWHRNDDRGDLKLLLGDAARASENDLAKGH